MRPVPTHLSETRGWNPPGLSVFGGKSLADLEKPVYEHVCGNCRAPITNKGRDDCPNARRASQVEPYREGDDGSSD